jgi:hypothetical protein
VLHLAYRRPKDVIRERLRSSELSKRSEFLGDLMAHEPTRRNQQNAPRSKQERSECEDGGFSRAGRHRYDSGIVAKLEMCCNRMHGTPLSTPKSRFVAEGDGDANRFVVAGKVQAIVNRHGPHLSVKGVTGRVFFRPLTTIIDTSFCF